MIKSGVINVSSIKIIELSIVIVDDNYYLGYSNTEL